MRAFQGAIKLVWLQSGGLKSHKIVAFCWNIYEMIYNICMCIICGMFVHLKKSNFIYIYVLYPEPTLCNILIRIDDTENEKSRQNL